MHPVGVLRIWLLGLLGFGLIILGGSFLYEWYEEREREELYWAIGLLVFALGGQWLVRPFVGGRARARRPQVPPFVPRHIRGHENVQLHASVFPAEHGPTFVLIHGWSLHSVAWQYLVNDLAQHGQVVLMDLRGLGRSDKSPSGDYSLESMAHDLAAVVKQFDDRAVILVGHSIGGMICQTFFRLYPELQHSVVKGLVIVDSTYTNPLKTALFAPLWAALQKPVIEPLLHLTVWLSPLVRLMNISSYFNGTTHITTRITSFAGAQTWGQLELASRVSSFASPAVVARGMLAMLRFDEQATLPAIRIPSLIIAGVNDRVTKIQANRDLAAGITGSELLPLEPGGHLSLLERCHDVGAAIASHGAASVKRAEVVADPA